MASDGDDAAFDESFFDAPTDDDGAQGQEQDSDAAGETLSTPVNNKRKRGLVNTPGTVNDEDEVARRRRRRQSLAFAQRRKSLTLSGNSGANKQSDAAGSGATGAPGSGGAVARSGAFSRTLSTTTSNNNRQYVSDMYSTIIKMSSENVRTAV